MRRAVFRSQLSAICKDGHHIREREQIYWHAMVDKLKNIVGKDIYEETWNADMNYLKIVSTTSMHRAALLGINFVF